MDKNQKDRVVETIRELFTYDHIFFDDEHLDIFVELGQISFESLERLSHFFMTKKINIRYDHGITAYVRCGYDTTKHIICIEVSDWGELKAEKPCTKPG